VQRGTHIQSGFLLSVFRRILTPLEYGRVNGDNVDGACEELRRWIYAGGQKWRGLMNRRDMERTMCLAESADDLKG
jgi:hypothetical protein